MSAVTIELGEAEAICSDIDEAINETLDAMLLSENERERLTGALMKLVSARYVLRAQLREAFAEEQAKKGRVPS